MGIITIGFVFSAISGIISRTLYIEMEEKVTGVKLTGAQEDRSFPGTPGRLPDKIL